MYLLNTKLQGIGLREEREGEQIRRYDLNNANVEMRVDKHPENYKMFLGGSKSVSKLTTAIMDQLDRYFSDDRYEFIVGDCHGVDTLFQQVLFEADIKRVTVYTSEDEPRVNTGNWPVIKVEAPDKGRNPYLHHAAKDQKMAEDAGSAFMLWDGRSNGTAANIAGMILADKPCHVVMSETAELFKTETYKEPASMDGLRAMLPEPKANRIGCYDAITKELLEKSIPELVKSKAVGRHLIETGLTPGKMIGIILGAPVPLEKKAAILGELADRESFLHDFCDELEKNEGPFSAWEIMDVLKRYRSSGHCLREIRKALAALDCGDGGILLLTEAVFDEESSDEQNMGAYPYYAMSVPFRSYDAAIEHIRNEIDIWVRHEDTLVWYVLEKCVPDSGGRMPVTYRYYLIGDEAVYFDKICHDSEDELDPCVDFRFSNGRTDPDFPIPFKAGDIVMLDCRPFAPVKRVLLLEVDNSDCCGVRMLHRDSDGLWRNSALKHKHGWGSYRPLLSPLYRLEKYGDALDKDHRILLDYQRFIRENENNAAAVEKITQKKGKMTAEEAASCIDK